MKRHSVRFSALLAAALLAACAGKHTARPEWLDLNGTWRLNEQESERPMAGGDMPPADRRMGGRGGRGRTGEVPRQRADFAAELMQGLREFRLSQTDSTIRFSFGAKRGVVVPTNGKKVKTDMWPGAPVMGMSMGNEAIGEAPETELRAQWTADGLQLERSFGRGSIKELWTRAPQSKRLVITTEIGQRKLRRVYDLVESR